MKEERIKKYFDEANTGTEIGEHLFVLNTLLSEIVKNTTPDIIGVVDSPPAPYNLNKDKI